MARKTFRQRIASADDVPRESSDAVQALFHHPSTGEGRRTPIRPAEKRRLGRMITVTFSYNAADYPERLRALARRWGWLSNNGRPNSSAVVEFLVARLLETAERGDITPPSAG